MRFFLAAVFALCLSPHADADVFTFETPSGNIDCSGGVDFGASDVICTIHETEAPPPVPRPAFCGTDWGHTYALRATGPVEMMCQPRGANTAAFEKAPYGVTGGWGDIVCRSETTGLTCQNASGHGFMLSRRSISIW